MPLPSGFKPMLAGKAIVDDLRYPLLASPKLDGIRAVVSDGIVLSRNLKPIPNRHIQSLFGHHRYNHLDGELIVGSATSKTCFNTTTSGVMSQDGVPDVVYYVFDHIEDPKAAYIDRYLKMTLAVAGEASKMPRIIIDVEQTLIANGLKLAEYEEAAVTAGFEGVMLRKQFSPYKFGRSTFNEGALLKLKRWDDSEAEILGFEEKMHNANEAKTNALGHSERSSHKENKVPMGVLGALNVQDVKSGIQFQIGTGFDDQLRSAIWYSRNDLKGKIVKYKFQPVGVMEKPRFPVFMGFRDRIDF